MAKQIGTLLGLPVIAREDYLPAREVKFGDIIAYKCRMMFKYPARRDGEQIVQPVTAAEYQQLLDMGFNAQ